MSLVQIRAGCVLALDQIGHRVEAHAVHTAIEPEVHDVENGPEAVVTASVQNYDRAHLRNFLDCIASGKRPNADVEEGHRSTRWCHLGNVAQRLGRAIEFDAKSETIKGDEEANKLLARTYRKGFEVPEKV